MELQLDSIIKQAKDICKSRNGNVIMLAEIATKIFASEYIHIPQKEEMINALAKLFRLLGSGIRFEAMTFIDPSAEHPITIEDIKKGVKIKKREPTYTVEVSLGEKTLWRNKGLSEDQKKMMLKEMHEGITKEHGTVCLNDYSGNEAYIPIPLFKQVIFKVTKND